MNLKCRLILEDYRRQRDAFALLGETVHQILSDIAKDKNVSPCTIEHRVKEEKSLAGKLERKGDRYNSLEDITDILGCRLVCFLSDEIDRISSGVEEIFVIDRENSSDKRSLLNVDSFGYLSLHYICSLPSNGKWPEEICNKKFEIQIRTILQHAWSVINHDIGYKSDFGVPAYITRRFARLAGLLELADDEFIRTRDSMVAYTQDIRNRIKTDDADEISISMISLREYVQENLRMKELIAEIAGISNAEIDEIDPENYIEQLAYLGITNLGGIEKMIKDNRELALKLAKKSLENADLDIVSSSVALRFLCRAELISKGYSEDRITEFLKLSLRDDEKARRQAKHLLRQKEEL